MSLSNPCKRCLVRPACHTICDPLIDYCRKITTFTFWLGVSFVVPMFISILIIILTTGPRGLVSSIFIYSIYGLSGSCIILLTTFIKEFVAKKAVKRFPINQRRYI